MIIHPSDEEIKEETNLSFSVVFTVVLLSGAVIKSFFLIF